MYVKTFNDKIRNRIVIIFIFPLLPATVCHFRSHFKIFFQLPHLHVRHFHFSSSCFLFVMLIVVFFSLIFGSRLHAHCSLLTDLKHQQFGKENSFVFGLAICQFSASHLGLVCVHWTKICELKWGKMFIFNVICV